MVVLAKSGRVPSSRAARSSNPARTSFPVPPGPRLLRGRHLLIWPWSWHTRRRARAPSASSLCCSSIASARNRRGAGPCGVRTPGLLGLMMGCASARAPPYHGPGPPSARPRGGVSTPRSRHPLETPFTSPQMHRSLMMSRGCPLRDPGRGVNFPRRFPSLEGACEVRVVRVWSGMHPSPPPPPRHATHPAIPPAPRSKVVGGRSSLAPGGAGISRPW